ncbi:hypothetical protein [Raineya orbicola]|jgi:ABC-type multidrug transport system fused ATPase/permease subunit|uniref:Uncharacterized protein n=1 Tax=Raineya orbicola TaxID=2016530 RepID=A0A2N3IJR3_9BACT|nr:hypothetical protein [Raineya orbicola]PKQ70565.1 hypothetical protein Rain11_0485 [Raineya orbicola]
MKSIYFFLLCWFLAKNVAIAQNESAVRMIEAETISSTEKVIEKASHSPVVQTIKAISAKQVEPLQTNELVKPAPISGRFAKQIKKNLKPQKNTQENNPNREGKFWAGLFGLISSLAFVLLFGEAVWGIFLVSIGALIISFIINARVGSVFAVINLIVSLILVIVGISSSNGMALLLGLLMLAFTLGLMGVGSASSSSTVIFSR